MKKNEKKEAQAAEKPEKPSSKEAKVKTTDLFLSRKLQTLGVKVLAMTGGTIAQKKTHYFDKTLTEIKALVNDKDNPLDGMKDRDGNRVFTDDEIRLFPASLTKLVSYEVVEKTEDANSDIKERLEAGNPKDADKGVKIPVQGKVVKTDGTPTAPIER